MQKRATTKQRLCKLGGLGAALASVVLVLPAQAGFAKAVQRKLPAAAASYYLRAQIIAATATAIGSSITGGSVGSKYGYALTANGVSGNWATGDYTINFVVLTYSSHDETGTVSFKVVAPGGSNVYHYSWPNQKVPAGVDWFTVGAKANYSAAGTYFAELYFGGSMVGWVPLNFSTS